MKGWPYRELPGLSRYVVHASGRVFRFTDVTHPLRMEPRNGYLRVRLRGDDGRRRWRPVHTLMLEGFVGPRPTPRHHGAHKDGKLHNNVVTNLKWKLPPDNEADKKLHGTAPKGGAQKRLHPLRRRAIVRRIACGESRTRVGARFGIHRSTVTKVLARVGVQG